MRKNCDNGHEWCRRCWYGNSDACSDGVRLTWREQRDTLFAAWLVLWSMRINIFALRLLDRARRMDSETVAYLESLEAEEK